MEKLLFTHLGKVSGLSTQTKSSTCENSGNLSSSKLEFAERMLQEHIAFVQMRARELSAKHNVCLDELVQSGRIAIMHAAGLYREDTGVKFLTYAKFHITKEMYNSIQRQRVVYYPRRKMFDGEEISLSAPVTQKSGNTTEFGDLIPDNADVREEICSREELDNRQDAIQSALNKLKPSYRQTIHEYFFNNRTYEEIGKIMGVSRQRIHQRVSMGLKILREELAQIDLAC